MMDPNPMNPSGTPNGVLVRFDEIFLKRGRRSHFLDLLDRNLRRALRPFPELDLRRPYGRLLIVPRGARGAATAPPLAEPERVVRALSRVFGAASLSPVWILPPGKDALWAALPDLVDGWLAERPVRTFAIATRRVDKSFPLGSTDANRAMGGLVLERHPDLKVDLGAPELRVSVEIRAEETFVFREVVQGPGGLPVGSNGKLLALLSGGIDSPVAAWSILRRGAEVEAVYFHSFPYTSDAAKEKVRDLARLVGQWQGGMRLHVVPFTDVQTACRDAAQPKDLVLLYRRFMFRIAERIAQQVGALGLVTGESLGQVASQTLPNMDCIQRVVTLPVYRPLIAHDKQDTIRLARTIGTYDLSVQPFDDCCSLFVPKHPELRGRPGVLARVEERLDVEALVGAALAGVEVIEL